MITQIIPYAEQYQAFFTALNKSWVEKYFVLEAADKDLLYHAREHIIDKGGYIYFAQTGDTISGTFALIYMEPGVYELSKMAVAESFQGYKIGNKMLEYCLEEAKILQAKKIILYSNTQLQPAIHLYKKYGFREVPLESSTYKRTNIKMEIDIL